MTPLEVARVRLPTPFGTFDLRAFTTREPGFVQLALVAGKIGDGDAVLTRIHSECLTGDALGSLRCDCGVQLRAALRTIGAAGRGVLLYATGHEGRGVGLVNKLRAYVEQDLGADTVDANLHLGLPVDGRSFAEAADVLKQIGVRSVELITNNPRKVADVRGAGIVVASVRPLAVASNGHTVAYLQTKAAKLGHEGVLGRPVPAFSTSPPDVSTLIGSVTSHVGRPHVVLKYAQSLDGRIATSTGDARWISCEDERALSHALRARCDAIMVGVGTVFNDDPSLTVRLVPGPSPVRVVLDSKLRAPLDANVFDDGAPTIVFTTDNSSVTARAALEARDVAVRVVPRGPGGVDIAAVLGLLGAMGISSVLVEGGQRVITSLLRAWCVDRVIVSVAPIMLGEGVEGVGDLGTLRVADAISLRGQTVHQVGDDVVIASDVAGPGGNGHRDVSGAAVSRARSERG